MPNTGSPCVLTCSLVDVGCSSNNLASFCLSALNLITGKANRQTLQWGGTAHPRSIKQCQQHVVVVVVLLLLLL
jgi:hypothetical protein